MCISNIARVRRWTRLWLIAVATLLGVAPAAAQPVPAVTEYYHLDALGSTRVVTSQTGTVLRHYEFGPFGGQDSPCTQSPDKRLFTGHVRDRETCLDYFGARHMRSTFGRFLTIDPVLDTRAALVDPQQWNRYAYARNNPMKFVDPDGKNPMLVVASIIWAVTEVASSAYDVYNAYATVADSAAGSAEKGAAIVGAAISVVGPVGGYGSAATTVYRSVNAAESAVQYVGITNNLSRRAVEHLTTRGIQIEAIGGLDRLSRSDARAVEQALIEIHPTGQERWHAIE